MTLQNIQDHQISNLMNVFVSRISEYIINVFLSYQWARFAITLFIKCLWIIDLAGIISVNQFLEILHRIKYFSLLCLSLFPIWRWINATSFHRNKDWYDILRYPSFAFLLLGSFKMLIRLMSMLNKYYVIAIY